ncbi:choice-of-anchor D domain-containing protein [Solihabitans fulvus]|uniref:choice-of-anchor D domain-containing protein n=1 Tax=Solihabitans fulvus TaxID=1892852 RepID=UPI001661EB82|nr:choice-of-anchor D domain-containing protein [Solihabitans fulvus]
MAVLCLLAVILASIALLLAGAPPSAVAAVSPGSTQRASVRDNGGEAPHGGNESAISGNGRWVAFAADGGVDPLDDNNEFSNIYVRDLTDGHTVLITRGQFPASEEPKRKPPEYPADSYSTSPSISADGRYVAFTSSASNLVSEDFAGSPSVMVCDRDPGGTGTLDRKRPDGSMDYRYTRVDFVDHAASSMSHPKLSADGSRLVWQKTITYYDFVRTGTLAPDNDVTKPWQADGVRDVAGYLSPSLPGHDYLRPTNQSDPTLSADGRYAALMANYTEHVPPIPRFAATDLITVSGALVEVDLTKDDDVTSRATRVDLDEHGATLGDGYSAPEHPSLSGDGRLVAFNMQGSYRRNYLSVVYLVDRGQATNGTFSQTPTSRPVSTTPDGTIASGGGPSLSTDGRYLAFDTDALGMHNGLDRATRTYSCLYQAQFGAVAPKSVTPHTGGTVAPQDSTSTPPPPPVVRTACQVVVRDLVADQARRAAGQPQLPAELASPSTGLTCVPAPPAGSSCPGDNDSYQPTLSADGGRVAFSSDATDLIANDTNKSTDAFVRTFQPEPKADPLDFGQVVVGDTSTKTLTVNYGNGFGPLTLGQVTIGGAQAGDFTIDAQTCQGRTLHAGDSCLVSVRFTPAATGDRQGEVSLSRRDAPASTIPARGTGVPPSQPPPPPIGPQFHVTPDPVVFGEQLPLSPSPTATVTVSNTGDTNLPLGDVAVSQDPAPATPGDFTLPHNTCQAATLSPGATCQVSVVFTPQAAGDRTAVLSFQDHSPGAAPHLVALRGSGAQPAIDVSPTVSPPGRVATVTGHGFAPLRTIIVNFPGYPESVSVQSTSAGTITAALVVYPNSAEGNRVVQAAVDGFPSISATKPFLVVPGTLNPPDFATRH